MKYLKDDDIGADSSEPAGRCLVCGSLDRGDEHFREAHDLVLKSLVPKRREVPWAWVQKVRVLR